MRASKASRRPRSYSTASGSRCPYVLSICCTLVPIRRASAKSDTPAAIENDAYVCRRAYGGRCSTCRSARTGRRADRLMDVSYLPNRLWSLHLHTEAEVAKRLLPERDDLLDERDALRGESEGLRVKMGELSAELVRSKRAARPDFVELAQVALSKYGRHGIDCHQVFNAGPWGRGSSCDCGLEAAFRELAT